LQGGRGAIRSLLGCLLLSVAALAAIESAVDAAAYHVSVRQQWRTQHQSPHRVSQRKTPGVLGDVARLTFLSLIDRVPATDPPDLAPPLPTQVFVPPRS